MPRSMVAMRTYQDIKMFLIYHSYLLLLIQQPLLLHKMIILVGCLLAKKEKEKEKEKVSFISEYLLQGKLGLSASPHVSEHQHTSSSGNLVSEHHTLPYQVPHCTQLQYIHNKLNVQPLQHGKAFNTVINLYNMQLIIHIYQAPKHK